MSGNRRLRQASSTTRLNSSRSFAGAGEVIGETTAECAVVCCCLPCAVANLLVLAIVKVPAGLCRRALRRHRKRKSPARRRRRPSGYDLAENQIHPKCTVEVSCDMKTTAAEVDKELQQLEKEMWEMFYATGGFWRSLSQRESPDPIASTKPGNPISPKWEISNLRSPPSSELIATSSASTFTSILL